jgi:hypothetical protein
MEATFHAITYSDIFINVIDKNKRLLMSRRSVFESFWGHSDFNITILMLNGINNCF